jgi:hypothetical protein
VLDEDKQSEKMSSSSQSRSQDATREGSFNNTVDFDEEEICARSVVKV